MRSPGAVIFARLTAAALLASALLAAPPVQACSGTVTLAPEKGEFQTDAALDATVFFNQDGNCGKNDGVSMKLTWNIGGQFYDPLPNGAAICPQENKGNDIWCAVVNNGQTYQFHYAGKYPTPPPGATKGYLEGWVYVGGTLLGKVAAERTLTAGGGAAGPSGAAPQTPSAPPTEIRLAVAIGNLFKTASIAEYIAAIYGYALGIVTTIAVAMVVWGGVKYLTAGGDTSRVKSAKETIGNAFLGLLLVLGAWMILNTINPALTRLKPLTIPKVEKILFTQGKEKWCETLNPDSFVVDPPPPQDCGKTGKVSTKGGGAVEGNDQCVFKSCPVPKQCNKNPGSGQYGCQECGEVGKNQLGALGVLPGQDQDSACASFGPPLAAKYGPDEPFRACVYVNDLGGFRDGECRMMMGSCHNIKTCEDYGKKVMLGKKEITGANDAINAAIETLGKSLLDVGNVRGNFPFLRLDTERRCFFDVNFKELCIKPSVPAHFAALCNSDPCGVGGAKGCAIKEPDLTENQKKYGVDFFKLNYLPTTFGVCEPR